MSRTPPRARRTDPLIAAAKTFEGQQNRSTARDLFNYSSWQEEAWSFHESLGEFEYAVRWLSQAMSRVRLTAAEMVPGGDEPEPITEGPAAEAVGRLSAGIGGQSALMKTLAIQLSVPGEGWVVGEATIGGAEDWTVRSSTELRPAESRGAKWEVLEDANLWRPLPPDALVTRVWDPDPRRRFLATSAAKAALPIMRRIDLIDRRIVSTMVSRLAMNGILLIPQEGTFSAPPQYKDAPDPFVQWLIDIASNNIKNPGSASAAIPMPVKFSKDLIEKWKRLTFGDGLPKELLEERDKELRRLATTVNVPAEIVLGMGDANHWTAWQLEESAIKLHISPVAEIISDGLTRGFLQPLLAAEGLPLVGPNGGRLVVWYDTSELTARPDKSSEAFRAYDRLELSGEALIREIGLDEGDRPDSAELKDLILKQLARSIQLGPWVIEQLTGLETEPPQAPAGSAGGPDEPSAVEPAGDSPDDERRRTGTPDTQREVPPVDDDMAAALARMPAWLQTATVPPADWDRDGSGSRSPPELVGAGSSNGSGKVNGHRPRGRRR